MMHCQLEKEDVYFLSLLPRSAVSLCLCSSSPRSPSLHHSSREPRDHAGRQREHHLRRSRLSDALRQVDAEFGGPDAGGRDACGPERSGAERRARVGQLHLRRHEQPGNHRGCGASYR